MLWYCNQNANGSPEVPYGDMMVHSPPEISYDGQHWTFSSFYRTCELVSNIQKSLMRCCDIYAILFWSILHHGHPGVPSCDLMVLIPPEYSCSWNRQSLALPSFHSVLKVVCGIQGAKQWGALMCLQFLFWPILQPTRPWQSTAIGYLLVMVWSTPLWKTPEMVKAGPCHLVIGYEN